MRPMPFRVPLTAAAFAGLLAIPAIAQQANSTNATLRINGTETGAGPMSSTVTFCSGFNIFISSGGNPSQPFTLVNGTLQAGATTFPGIGTLDINPALPNFTFLMDGIFGGAFGGAPILNAIARTDLGGQFSFGGAIGFGAPGGAIGAFQAVVVNPAAAAGFTMTAATNVTVLSAAVGGTLAPAADSAVAYAFTQGFTFPFYGTTYTGVNVHENGCIGFGALATLQAGLAPAAAGTQPTTNSTGFLGTGGLAVPPIIGFFEDLSIAANGGSGSIIYSESATQFAITYCTAAVAQGGANSTVTIQLFGAGSATPGRIEVTVSQASTGTVGNGRVFGISPGGNGTVSNSPGTNTSVNISAVSRNIVAGGVNNGFAPAAALSAIYESFNFAWAADPINPVFDFQNVIMRFDPTVPASGTGPYRLRALSEAGLSVVNVNPISSTLTGGVPITIRGTGFRNDGTTSATLGTLAVTGLTYTNSETLTGTVPASPSAQTVNVNVSVGSLPATASLAAAFTYSVGPLNGTLPLLDEEFATYNFTPSLLGNFNLYGTNFTRVFVHANGHAMFAAAAPLTGNANFISDPPTWNAFTQVVIAPMFNDLCGDPAGCTPFVGTPSVTTVETATSLTVRWNQWSQWPTINPGLTFSFVLDKTFAPANRVIFDYSLLPVAPNVNVSQPGGASGIIVGMKPAGASAAGPRNLVTSSGGALGVPGPSQGVNANMFHWMRSAGNTGAVATTTPNWVFGTTPTPGPIGNRTIEFLSIDANNNNFTITLN